MMDDDTHPFAGVEILLSLDESGQIQHWVRSWDDSQADGSLSLMQALGCLELAKDTIMRARMGED